MPISSKHVGRVYRLLEPYLVTSERIAAFADSIGDDSERYRGPDAVAPPTFTSAIVTKAWDLLFADPELDVALRHVIHGDQVFRYHRPLRVGDVVTGELTIEKVWQRGTTDWMKLRVDIVTTAGEPICEAALTLLHMRGEAA